MLAGCPAQVVSTDYSSDIGQKPAMGFKGVVFAVEGGVVWWIERLCKSQRTPCSAAPWTAATPSAGASMRSAISSVIRKFRADQIVTYAKPYHFQPASDRIYPEREAYLKHRSERGMEMKGLQTAQQEQVMGYLAYLREEERSEQTIQKYARDVVRFLAFARGDVDKSALLAWKAQLVAGGYAPQTINAMLAAVNGFLSFLGRGDQRVRPVKCQRTIFRARERELSKAEYLRLLDAARRQGKDRLFLIMETVCATGIRVSELKYITVQAVQDGRAVVNCKGKCRVILIPRKLCRQLQRWARDKKTAAGPVFQTSGGKPIDRSNIWREMKAMCGAAGVDPQKVFPHNLRHLFAVAFYAVEKDIAKLADVLGHTSITTTRIYIMEAGAEHERQLSRLGLVL